jgi:hypothetical protein
MLEKVLNFFMLAGDDVEKFSIVCRDEYANGHYCSPGAGIYHLTRRSQSAAILIFQSRAFLNGVEINMACRGISAMDIRDVVRRGQTHQWSSGIDRSLCMTCIFQEPGVHSEPMDMVRNGYLF